MIRGEWVEPEALVIGAERKRFCQWGPGAKYGPCQVCGERPIVTSCRNSQVLHEADETDLEEMEVVETDDGRLGFWAWGPSMIGHDKCLRGATEAMKCP